MHGKPGKHQWRGDGSEPGFEIGKTAQFMMVRSQDDGVTWSEPINLTPQLKAEEWILLAPSPQQVLLDEGAGFGYPSISRVDDEHVGVVYEGSQSH